MDNRAVLQEIERGYRMPQPVGRGAECPKSLYDIMLTCWEKVPEKRPTFEYLHTVFEDYFVATEGSYRESEGI